MKSKPQLLIFDVNETLLDLSPLKESINQLLEDSNAFEDWFSNLIQMAMVETLTGHYSDFGEIGLATLKMTAKKLSKSISHEELTSSLQLIRELPPHPDVRNALEILKSEGFRLVALTNGSSATLKQQMEYSELDSVFDAFYSVEAVQKFKPHQETYGYVLAKELVKAKQAMLVAAHAWDIAGAQPLGMQTAFIKRPGKIWYPNKIEPSLTCSNFDELSKALI